MSRKKFFMLAVCVVIGGAASAGESAADDYDHHTIEIERKGDWSEVSGYVEQVGDDPRVIVVKAYNDADSSIYTDRTFYVVEEARIIKDCDLIPLHELHPNDYVTVRYLISSDFQREAYKIWVK